MKVEENDIAKGLKRKRDSLCQKLGIDSQALDEGLLGKSQRELSTERIADLSRALAEHFANSQVADEVVISWLEDYLKDLKSEKMAVPLASMRINATLAEKENFGV